MINNHVEPVAKNWRIPETICAIWVGLALASLVPVTSFLQGSFPLFTVVWLIVPMLVVLRTANAQRVGFRSISWKMFFRTTAINLLFLCLISILIEPWSHAYQSLVKEALAGTPPDTTFAWLIRYQGWKAWVGLLVYSGVVTIFGEELFFRGWLLQALQYRMQRGWAIILQAVLFSLPQMLAALLLPPLQGAVYAIGYSWLAVGVIGGWSASRTQSIWPSLVAATIWNALMIAWLIGV